MQVLKYYEIDYSLKNEEGKVVDTSEGGEPLIFVQGDGRVVKGLEDALNGKDVGDKFSVVIAPEDAYGWPQRSLIRTIGNDMFDLNIDEVEVGMLFQVGSGDEAQVVRVVAVENGEITIDGNHPLVGLSLNFDIEVRLVRDATADEMDWMNDK